jgi:hypothetical protein
MPCNPPQAFLAGDRRRGWPVLAALTLGLLAGPALGLVDGPRAVAAEQDTPTVTFENGPGRSCASAPEVTSLSVPVGTAVVVANAIQRDATVYVAGESIIAVASGSGALLNLAAGQHDVRLVPVCLAYADAEPLIITVTESLPESSPPPDSGPTEAAVTAPPPAPAPRPTTARPPLATTAPGDGTASTVVPAAASASPDAQATRVSTSTPADRTGVLAAGPVDLDGTYHSKGVRLLAVVATICVLGVTAAIIRSIVRLSP